MTPVPTPSDVQIDFETHRSKENAETLERSIKCYFGSDHRLLFYPRFGHYYIAKKMTDSWEPMAIGDLGKDEDSIYSHAFRRGLMVIAQPADPLNLRSKHGWPHPLSVRGLENYGRASELIFKHLKDNDMRALAATPAERVRVMEAKMDAEEATADAHERDRARGEMQAYARDYYRRKFQIKSFIPSSFGDVEEVA